jgi:hypothetical protein
MMGAVAVADEEAPVEPATDAAGLTALHRRLEAKEEAMQTAVDADDFDTATWLQAEAEALQAAILKGVVRPEVVG